MTVTIWRPYATATINGTQISTALLNGARVEMSFADPVSKAYVKCIGAPSWGQGDDLTVTLGGGGNGGANNTTRFPAGNVWQGDYMNSGPNFELVGRGPLYAVQKYRMNRAKGLTLTDLTGGPATDQAIQMAVLDVVGVPYSGGNIGGTGIVRGALAPDGYTWKRGETALAYSQRLTKASLGYKLVESNGQIFRTQVTDGIPTGTADFTFTEGEDIFEGAHTQRETFNRFTSWEVTGFDFGDGFGPVRFGNPDVIPDGEENYAYSSEMIERALDIDPGGGISCETVEAYVENNTDHEITHISGLVTPRDDDFGPGQIITINSALLGATGQKFWLVGVTCETDPDWYQTTLELVG